MPVIRCLPNAVGTNNGWTLGAGASKVAAVSVNDDGTTYINGDYATAGAVAFQSFKIGYPGFVALAANPVSVGCRVKYPLWGGAADGVRWNVYLSGARTRNGPSGVDIPAYADLGPTVTARPGGGSYTIADLPNLEAEVEVPVTTIVTTCDCTFLYLDIDGTLPQQGYSFLVSSLVGGALGLSEMARLARYVYRKSGSLIRPAEYLEAWRDIREHRHPRFFILGAR